MKVFLKFNRTQDFAYDCLSFWLDVFKDYDIYIVTDIFKINRDKIPQKLKNLIVSDIGLINSDYTTSQYFSHLFNKGWKRAAASANITCWQYCTKHDKMFWLIDADDTRFLNVEPSTIIKKLKQVENVFVENEYDGLSLDFYREIFDDHWSFGVCLMSSQWDPKELQNINPPPSEVDPKISHRIILNNGVPVIDGNTQLPEEYYSAKQAERRIIQLRRYFKNSKILPKIVYRNEVDLIPTMVNLDAVFDFMRRKNMLKLESFVLENETFQHVVNKLKEIPNGIYHWKDGMLNDTYKIPNGVISI